MERGLHRSQASLLSDLWQGYRRHMDPILPPARWPGEDTPHPTSLSLCHPTQSRALGDSLQAGWGLRIGESKVSLENHIQPAGRY